MMTTTKRLQLEDIEIRPARGDDLKALWPLYEQLDEMHRQARPDLFHVPPGDRRSRAFLQERIDAPSTVCLVAVKGGEIIGLCTTMIRETPETIVKPAWRYAEIDEIVVEAAHRRQGVATQLFEAAVAWARQQPDIRDMLLSVYELNDDARRFYESKGFKTLHRKMEFRL